MKNYICTAKGFVQGVRFDNDSLKHEILYTDKVRYAQQFKTNGATKFMENHDIKGFVWKPYEQEPIRNMYEVKKVHMAWKEEKGEKVEDWRPVKAIMRSESDIAFLSHGNADNVMTFEEAKTEALMRNNEMLGELNEKVTNLKELKENE